MQSRRIFMNTFIMLFIVLLHSACSKSGSNTTPPPPAAGDNVNIANFAFVPATLTVKQGEIIKWKNEDGVAHTVTSDDGTTFSSGNVNAGSTFSFTAATPGTYAYHCNIHPGMKGTIIVTQ